jgi:hypothetical protein
LVEWLDIRQSMSAWSMCRHDHRRCLDPRDLDGPADRSLACTAGQALTSSVWLVWLSIGLQLVITLIPGFPNWLGQPLHLFTFGLSAVFLWSNRHIPAHCSSGSAPP